MSGTRSEPIFAIPKQVKHDKKEIKKEPVELEHGTLLPVLQNILDVHRLTPDQLCEQIKQHKHNFRKLVPPFKMPSAVHRYASVREYDSQVIEKGTINFFYRPKLGVEAHEAKTPDDAQRFYIELRPSEIEGAVASKLHPFKNRLLILGAKALPKPKPKAHGTDRNPRIHWAFVMAASPDVRDLTTHLEAKDYTTKTRGDRHLSGVVPAGQGIYEFVRLDKLGRPKLRGAGKTKDVSDCLLAYILEIPEEPGSIQHAFNIHKEAAFHVQVRNPQRRPVIESTGAPSGLQKDVAHYPKKLQDLFHGTMKDQLKFIPLLKTDFLNYERAEILLVATTHDLKYELGQLGEELEEEEWFLEKYDEKLYGKVAMEDKIYTELHMKKEEHPDIAVALTSDRVKSETSPSKKRKVGMHTGTKQESQVPSLEGKASG